MFRAEEWGVIWGYVSRDTIVHIGHGMCDFVLCCKTMISEKKIVIELEVCVLRKATYM